MNLPFISHDNPLILASASPRRKSLLAQIHLPFRSRAALVSERNVTEKNPVERSLLLAERKALGVHAGAGESWVLGADTMVLIDDAILGKPADEEEAAHMLRLLSGKEHRVLTGFCILAPMGGVAHREAVGTLVRMKKLDEEEIRTYIATGEPFGKAGSYAIQGIGAFMVGAIWGSYSNVVGLPLCALIKALLSVKALKRFPTPL